MGLFGIDFKGGSVSITLPDWMSKEYVEITIGGVIGGFGAGFVNGIVSSFVEPAVGPVGTQVVSGFVDLGISYLSHRFASRKPEFKPYLFGAALVTGINGLLKLVTAVIQAITKQTISLSVEGSYALGKVYGQNIISGNFRLAPRTPAGAKATVIEVPVSGYAPGYEGSMVD